MTIKCVHEKTLFCNEQTGFTIASYKTAYNNSIPAVAVSKFKPRDGLTAFTAVGNRLPTADGVEIELTGKWTDGGRYGMQLSVEVCSVVRPKTAEGIIAYLSSGLIKGIGDKTARAIVSRFGDKALDVLDKTPERLLEVPNITEKKLASIVACYRESVSLRDIMTELAPYGVTPKKAEKIHATYGAQAVELIKTNPYILCEITGFGFKTVDDIARKSGTPINDPHRINQGIIYALEQSQQSGYLFMPSEELCKNAGMLLSISVADNIIQKSLFDLVLGSHLHEEEGRIYLPKNYVAERETAKLAKAMIGLVNVNGDVDKIISQAEKACGITLADMQREAVKMAVTNKISIITGGPGTGKTTVVKVICAVYEKVFGGNIAFAAPTGRASRRLSESVEADADTLHRALGLREHSDEVNNTINADLLVVDEVSMVDMSLAHLLFKSLKSKTKLLLVGDHHQLPSVGAGNVLRELLQCGAIPATRLNVVHRQAQTSRINLNAHAILQNRAAGLLYGTDFEFVDAKTPDEAAAYVKKIYCGFINNLKKSGQSFAADEVQILAPVRVKGRCGTDALNKEIQDSLNPASADKPEIVVGFKRFRLHDKVMQTKNNGDVSNGDIGRIRRITKDLNGGYEVQIDFGGSRVVEYEADEMATIDLAYATTIHKSQGSEYPVVIIPILNEASIMLQRNLIYTAITRAKVKVILVGQKQALFKAIHKADVANRNTLLAFRIAG
ncbi:MAG: ATP-dependent RecD-like DNA helicase [Defluviitaleaceae bacterium]|nr:ATP-dependent RecD-like DNA helicase [Defluviitaleaceae bacterium]